MMSTFPSNMKRKLMVGLAFVMFVPTAISHNGGSYIIDVLIEIHYDRIFMRRCLEVKCIYSFYSW